MSKQYEITDDFVKSFTNEIIEILELDDDDAVTLGDQICRDLLVNGRNALSKHQDDIVPKVFDEIMTDNQSKLMSSLKKYFRLQWETQYASSHSWFISFLNEYEQGENHDIYENILTRTAQHGNRYMKDMPLLSIVLQLLFEDIDDDCLAQENNIFDDLWTSITNDGLQSIKKYSDYILSQVLDKQMSKQSVLFQALQEYYRSNVFLSLSQSGIKEKQNLYELALDDVVEHGWTSPMESIKTSITPNRHRNLLNALGSFYTSSQNSTTDHPSTNDEQQDNDNVIVVDENSQKIDDQEFDDKQSLSSFNSGNESNAQNIEQKSTSKTIFVSGLPKNITEKSLFEKLHRVFSTCGAIAVYWKTKQPDIWVLLEQNKSCLTGAARIKFKNPESVVQAIDKYHGKTVPILNNARISVRVNKSSTAPKPLMKSIVVERQSQPIGPVSIFWDIENVAVPIGVKAYDVVLNIRKRLIEDRGLLEDTFKTYCRSIHNIPLDHRAGLTHAGVLTQHIESKKCEVVDLEIRRDIQQFMRQHQTPATLVLISGDSDFINDINHLRFRTPHYTIVVYNKQAKRELVATANESIPWDEFTQRDAACETIQTVLKSQNTSSAPSSPRTSVLRGRTDSHASNSSSTPDLSLNKSEPVKQETAKKNKKKSISIPKKPVVTTGTNETEKKFACLLCTKKFAQLDSLQQHEQAQHKIGTLIDLDSTTHEIEENKSEDNLISFHDENTDCDE